MTTVDESNFSKVIHEVITLYNTLPAKQKKDQLLFVIDHIEGVFRKNKADTFSLEKLESIRQRVIKTGIIEAGLSNFGESVLFALFGLVKDIGIAQNKKMRRTIFFILLAAYFSLPALFLVHGLTLTLIKPSIMTSPITVSAWIIVGLFYTTVYFLLTYICEMLFRPLNKFKLNLIFFKYDYGFILTMMIIVPCIILNAVFLESKFVIPYLYPFIITTIVGVFKLNIFSILTTLLGAPAYIVTTVTSIGALWKYISKIFEKRKENKQVSVLSKVRDTTL